MMQNMIHKIPDFEFSTSKSSHTPTCGDAHDSAPRLYSCDNILFLPCIDLGREIFVLLEFAGLVYLFPLSVWFVSTASSS